VIIFGRIDPVVISISYLLSIFITQYLIYYRIILALRKGKDNSIFSHSSRFSFLCENVTIEKKPAGGCT